jgi:hypothetical protein
LGGSMGHWGDGDGEFEYPVGIAIDQNNSIYIVDPDLLRMQIFPLMVTGSQHMNDGDLTADPI